MALPMRYNPIPGTDLDLTDYRGSIVHLSPATTYEVELTLAGTSTTASLTATTWSEEFPVGETIRVGDRDTPLKITESGTPGAYRVYDGRGATIDVRHEHDACITVNASHVILRGFTLKGAGAAATALRRGRSAPSRSRGGTTSSSRAATSPTGAGSIPRPGSEWTTTRPSTPAARRWNVSSSSDRKLHHPRWDGSTWYEPKYPTHTAGAAVHHAGQRGRQPRDPL